MQIPPYRLLTIDTANHALLVVDGPSGYIESELDYEKSFTPTGLVITADNTRAYLPAAGAGGSGALFTANLETLSLYRLPINVPHITQFALAPNQIAYAVDPGGTLYTLDLASLTVKPCGHSAGGAICNGLAITPDGLLYSIWERENTGVLAVFDSQAKLVSEYALPGIPSGLTGTRDVVLVTFTCGHETLEGVALFRRDADYKQIIIELSAASSGQMLYPCSPLVTGDSKTAYVVNEDDHSLSVIDLAAATVTDRIQAGRPLSSLELVPNGPFALAGADNALMLVDLAAKRPLAITDTPRRLAPYFAILSIKT